MQKAITRELYDWLLQEKYADTRKRLGFHSCKTVRQTAKDASLIAKWRKPGFEYLCSLMAIDKRNTNFGTTAICNLAKQCIIAIGLALCTTENLYWASGVQQIHRVAFCGS